MLIVNNVFTKTVEEALTEGHGHQAHGSAESHLRFMVVVFAIAISPQAPFLIIVVMPWNPLVCMNLLHMLQSGLFSVRYLVRAIYRNVSIGLFS